MHDRANTTAAIQFYVVLKVICNQIHTAVVKIKKKALRCSFKCDTNTFRCHQVNEQKHMSGSGSREIAVPCSWLKWGAIHTASGPNPRQGWWLPACVPRGT